MKRLIFIGDVHGMKHSLQELIEKLSPASDDLVIFLGDLLDKGPDSQGVVSYIRSIRDMTNVVLIKGNHEGKHERFRRKMKNGKINEAKQMKKFDELKEITSKLLEEDIEFLESAVYYHQVDGYIAIHGGIPGNMKTLPSLPSPGVELSSKQRDWIELLTFTRYIGEHTGRMISLGREEEDDPFWAEVYDGRFGRAVFGHQPWKDGVHWFDNAIGIDTAAVHGHQLSALVVESGVETIVSVDCEKYQEFYEYYKQ